MAHLLLASVIYAEPVKAFRQKDLTLFQQKNIYAEPVSQNEKEDNWELIMQD